MPLGAGLDADGYLTSDTRPCLSHRKITGSTCGQPFTASESWHRAAARRNVCDRLGIRSMLWPPNRLPM